MFIQPDADGPTLRPGSGGTVATPSRGQARAPAGGQEAGQTGLRALLLTGSALLLAAPIAFVEPAAGWADDPELFRLLRGMAVLKGMLAALAFAAVWWRLGRTIGARLTAIYVGSVCVMALATGLIWQLTALPVASGLFHCATIALLVAAWRDVERPNRVPPTGSPSAPLNPTTGETRPPASSRRPQRWAPH